MRLLDGPLPRLWDGEPVEWGAFSETRTTLPLHVPADALVCEPCGSVDESAIAFGRRGDFRDLYAARCRHCGHDVVTDLRTEESWDLDETDYGPEGSSPPDRLF